MLILLKKTASLLKKTASLLSAVMLLNIPVLGYSAKSYALVEMKTGRVLASQNADLRMPMASTTKIMTGLIACESGRFDTVFTVPEEAIKVEGSSMGLQAGEKITLRDLTYGLLLESGNDAANTIAYCLEGSIPKFAEKMNERAEKLGLENTHFVNPSGLDNIEHYTTSLDLARLGAYAMQNKDFAKIVSTYKAKITYNGAQNGRTLCNHNELLKMYEGAIGIKTGFTKKSGRCLVSCAQRDGITLIAATLKCPDDWNVHKTLLDYGFGQLKSCKLFTSAPQISAQIVGGTVNSVKCTYSTDLNAGLKSDEMSRVKMQINMRKFYYAPVKANQKMGEIVFTLDGGVLAKTDIIANESAGFYKREPNIFEKFLNFFRQPAKIL